MNKLNCILFVQDSILEEKLIQRLHAFDSIEITDIIKDRIELIEKLNRTLPKLLFVDTKLIGIGAIEILRLIPKPPFVIALTEQVSIVPELIDNGFFDYINPKLGLDYFCKKISKVLNITHAMNNYNSVAGEHPFSYKSEKLPLKLKNHTFIKYKKSNFKLIFDDILFIRNIGNCLRIENYNGKIVYHNSTLKKFLCSLPNDKFVRINKSVIVNYNRIEKFEKNIVYLKNQPFSVSRIYTMNLKDMFRRIG